MVVTSAILCPASYEVLIIREVTLGSIASMWCGPVQVCFTLDTGHSADILGGPTRANRRHWPISTVTSWYCLFPSDRGR
jgi:hypothetical protein